MQCQSFKPNDLSRMSSLLWFLINFNIFFFVIACNQICKNKPQLSYICRIKGDKKLSNFCISYIILLFLYWFLKLLRGMVYEGEKLKSDFFFIPFNNAFHYWKANEKNWKHKKFNLMFEIRPEIRWLRVTNRWMKIVAKNVQPTSENNNVVPTGIC